MEANVLIVTYKAAEIFLVPTPDRCYGVLCVEFFWGEKNELNPFWNRLYITKYGKAKHCECIPDPLYIIGKR